MKVSVVGLGKIGLPLAVQFASKGCEVIGIDTNREVVSSTNLGLAHFPGEIELEERLRQVVEAGFLRASSDFSEGIPSSDIVVVVVPLYVDESGFPNFEWLDSAANSIARNLTVGTTVIFETTLPVGTTRERWKSLLETGSSLLEGKDFHLVFSPERVLSGRIFSDLGRYPKLIGGLSEEGAARAREFYEMVLDFDERPDLERGNGVWDLGSAEAAELAKLAETTYRDVNIGLANQFAAHAEDIGVDIYRVIEACNSQPYSHIHRPGVSVGGHCIPVYPNLYLHGDPLASIVHTARQVNLSMPERAVQQIEDRLKTLQHKKVVIFGAIYRANVKETAFSGVFPLRDALRKKGAIVTVLDPILRDDEITDLGLVPHKVDEPANCLLLNIESGFSILEKWQTVSDLQLIYDGRNSLPENLFPGVDRIVLGLL